MALKVSAYGLGDRTATTGGDAISFQQGGLVQRDVQALN